jgi:hypothetical protein
MRFIGTIALYRDVRGERALAMIFIGERASVSLADEVGTMETAVRSDGGGWR